LLERLLQKDFSESIRSGFEATGLYPLNKERVIAKMPRERGEEGNAVQQTLIDKLSQIRYNPPPTTRVPRPKKNEKLPPGAAYGGAATSSDEEAEGEAEAPSRGQRKRPSADSSDSDSSSSSSSDSDDDDDEDDDEDKEEGVRRRQVRGIVRRLATKSPRIEEPVQVEEDEDDPFSDDIPTIAITPTTEENLPIPDYRVDSYVACIYENGWYVGQVMNKEGKPEADEREEYVLVSFMRWTGPKVDQLKWPERLDILNVLKVGHQT